MRLLLCTVLVTACAPRVPAPALPDDPSARDLACSLADEVGPRLAGSAGDALAVLWALDKMKALGLVNVHAEAVKVPHWERGEASAELVAPHAQRLHLAALGGSVATPEAGVEAEVIGVPTLEALQALPREQVEGRIVFYHKVMERTPSGKGYGKTVDVRRSGAAEAAKKGAVASLIRSVGTSDSRFPHTGAMRYDPDASVPKIPAAALAIPDAELLRRLLARGGPVRLKLRLTSRALPEADSANVIGEVPGSAKPDEVVLLGAHLDSWDLGTGAVDDAAGVGVVLDVAHKLAAARPARTVRVVLFANEENGLKGARAYVEVHREELPKHVAALEVDSGSGPVTAVELEGGPGAAAAMEALSPALAALGLPPPVLSDAGGADTSELTGVPQVELAQNRARYFDVHHTADDTCDKIDPRELAQVAHLALLVTKHLVTANVDLGRVPEEPKK